MKTVMLSRDVSRDSHAFLLILYLYYYLISHSKIEENSMV